MSGVVIAAATAVATAAPPTFNTKLLLHCDGTNGSTTFTDSSNYGRTVTANGAAQVSTAQSKFGGASALFDGTDDYLSVADTASLELQSDYTIEFWVYLTSAPASYCCLLTKVKASNNYGPYAFYMTPDRALLLYSSSTGSSWDIANGKSWGTVALNTWVHIAAVRNGNTYYLFKDGTQTDTWTSSLTPIDIPEAVAVGGFVVSGLPGLIGYMDEVRLSSTARWTSAFTPPTSTYTAD